MSEAAILSVTGTKQSVGKSVVAANLAQALSETSKKVLLIDCDAQSMGDLTVITQGSFSHSVDDFFSSLDPINPSLLSNYFSLHDSGFYFLSGVKKAGEVFSGNSSFYSRISQCLSIFSYIVVDLGSQIENESLQENFLKNSSAIFFIQNSNYINFLYSKEQIGNLGSFGISSHLVLPVVNQYEEKTNLPLPSLEKNLNKKIFFSLPKDPSVFSVHFNRSGLVAKNSSVSAAAYSQFVKKIENSLEELKTLRTSSEQQERFTERDRSLIRLEVHKDLLQLMDLKKDMMSTKGDEVKEKRLKEKTKQAISEIVNRKNLPQRDKELIIKEVLDESLGLGPLEDLLKDISISEIMVNGYNQIFVEKKGNLQLSGVAFSSNLHLRNVIERIVTPIGRRIDEKTPYVDARLQDGSRVNAIIEPLAIDGPSLTIRKFASDPITAEHYIQWTTASKNILSFLKVCVENGLNVIISGGTGSGKTTLLNVLSSFIPDDERIVTIEDAAELQLKKDHIVRLETRASNVEGTGGITIRDLIRNSLRMRPDRIIVGECRDGAAMDMLSAMNTGHDGSMATVHANSPREAVGRLETLCMMADMGIPSRAIREQVSSALHLLVQISRLSDGSRKLVSVTEVVGMQGESVTLQEIFRFKEKGLSKDKKVIGEFQSTGLIPSFIEKLEAKGVHIPREIFSSGEFDSFSQKEEVQQGTQITEVKAANPTEVKETVTVQKTSKVSDASIQADNKKAISFEEGKEATRIKKETTRVERKETKLSSQKPPLHRVKSKKLNLKPRNKKLGS